MIHQIRSTGKRKPASVPASLHNAALSATGKGRAKRQTGGRYGDTLLEPPGTQ